MDTMLEVQYRQRIASLIKHVAALEAENAELQERLQIVPPDWEYDWAQAIHDEARALMPQIIAEYVANPPAHSRYWRAAYLKQQAEKEKAKITAKHDE